MIISNGDMCLFTSSKFIRMCSSYFLAVPYSVAYTENLFYVPAALCDDTCKLYLRRIKAHTQYHFVPKGDLNVFMLLFN